MMTLTVAQFKAIVLILTLVVAMGCSGGRVEEQSEVGESLGLHSDESGEENNDDVASDVAADVASDSLGHRPLKLVINVHGGDRIIFLGLHDIGVDCRNNGEYEKGVYLSCRYEDGGLQQINIVSETDSDEFQFKVMSERQSSYFISIEDMGENREGGGI